MLAQYNFGCNNNRIDLENCRTLFFHYFWLVFYTRAGTEFVVFRFTRLGRYENIILFEWRVNFVAHTFKKLERAFMLK